MYHRSAEFYDAIYSFKDYASEAAQLRERIARIRGRDAHTLLDVACGTGAHLAELRSWYAVEGVELSEAMLAIARRRLPDVALHPGDMRDFSLPRRFDVITCLFSSIGYTRVADEMRRAVHNMAAHLAPGGLLLVEPWFFPQVYKPGHVSADWFQRPDMKIARASMSELVDGISVIEMHHLVATSAGVESFIERHELGLFTEAEYADAFVRAGLDVEFEPEGLIGRGMFVGRARASSPRSG